MKINKVQLPYNSIFDSDSDFKFLDSYQSAFVDRSDTIDIQAVGVAFFTSSPKWVDQLFTLRNKIVRSLGLKVSNDLSEREELLRTFNADVGQQVGLFKVFHRSDYELILGEDDKHLDFRVSFILDKTKQSAECKLLTISTFVRFHNRMGRLYFLPVRPFHSRIVPAMLKAMTKQLEVKANTPSAT